MAGTYVTKPELEKAIRYLKNEINALRQAGAGTGGSAPPGPTGVPISRMINTTSPIAGGGTLSADLTLSLAGLSDLGTENYLLGVAAGGAAWEYKEILGTANQVIVTHAAAQATFSLPQDIHTEAIPEFQGIILGPDITEDSTWLIFRAYFDFGTSGSEDLIAAAISASGSGHTASGSTDVPGTRGTEWNLETHEFVSPAGLTQGAYPNGCLAGGLLITDNSTSGKFEGYSVADGSLSIQSAAHGFSQVRGLCSDGTYFYATGILTAGNVRAVAKYQISDFSLIGTWNSIWPEFQGPWGVRYNGGFVYTWDVTLKVFFKINVTTMAKDSSFAGPLYSPGNYYQIQSFDIDTAGIYIYAIAEPAAGSYFIKASLADGTLVTAGTTNINSSISTITHYAEGAEERFYAGITSGGSVAGKMNPATLDWYYSTAGVGLGHSPRGIAADENFLYAFFEDQGVDRHNKNDIGGTASTEAGILRIWINALGSLTQAGMIDSGLNLSMFGYVEGTQLKSTIATGTPPLVVASETLVPNLNADFLDGYHAAAFAAAAHSHALASLSDVLISSGEPTDGQAIVWDDGLGCFVPGNPTAVMGIADLTDVLISSGEPADGDVLAWSDGDGKWVPSPAGGSLALDDLTDVDAGSPSADDVLTFDGANWINQAPAAGGLETFLDNFADSSIFADWITYGTGASKTITESAGGTLDFVGSAGQDCSAGTPRIFLPVPFWPCEIETKLSAYNKGERTKAGMWIGPDGIGWASVGNVYLEQIFSTGDGLNNVSVEDASSSLATAANSTVPKWLKIRCMGSHKYAKWFFYYSTDGAAWTLLHTYSVAAVRGGLCCGLFIGNWYNQPAVTASFEYFKITPYTFTGPG